MDVYHHPHRNCGRWPRLIALSMTVVLLASISNAEESEAVDRFSQLISAVALQSDAGPVEPPVIREDDASSAGSTSGAASPGDSTVREEKYGEAPVDSSRQFLRRVTPLLSPGQCQVDYGFTYAINENQFSTLAGGGFLTDGHIRRHSIYTPLAVRYGWNENTQLSASLAIGWSHVEITDPLDDLSDSNFGIGDLQLGITRLLHHAPDSPSLIGSLTASLPTGDESNPLVLSDSGLGSGAWALGGNLLLVHSYDPVVVFYGAGYQYTFESTYLGQDFEFGHQINYNFGVGFSVNERVTLSSILLGSYITESAVNDVRLPDSNFDIARLRLALTTVRGCKIIEPFAEIGITDFAPSLVTGVIWTR